MLCGRQCEQKVNCRKNLLKEMCHFLPFKYVYFDPRKLIADVILSDFFIFSNLKTRIPNFSTNFTVNKQN